MAVSSYNARWMKAHPHKSFCELVIPGTHNSYSDTIDWSSNLKTKYTSRLHFLYRLPCLPCLISPWVKCQDLSIYDQLKIGVRYFDLRLSIGDDGTVVASHTFTCRTLASVLDDFARFFDEFGETEVVYIRAKYDYKNSMSFKNNAHMFALLLLSHPIMPRIVPSEVKEPWALPLRELTSRGHCVIFTSVNYLHAYSKIGHPLSPSHRFVWHNSANRNIINHNVRSYVNVPHEHDFNNQVHEINTVYTPRTRHVVAAIVYVAIFRYLLFVAACLLLCFSFDGSKNQTIQTACAVSFAMWFLLVILHRTSDSIKKCLPLGVRDLSVSSRRDAIEIIRESPLKQPSTINVFSVDYVHEDFCTDMITLNRA